jgi:hypothetical protein
MDRVSGHTQSYLDFGADCPVVHESAKPVRELVGYDLSVPAAALKAQAPADHHDGHLDRIHAGCLLLSSYAVCMLRPL